MVEAVVGVGGYSSRSVLLVLSLVLALPTVVPATAASGAEVRLAPWGGIEEGRPASLAAASNADVVDWTWEFGDGTVGEGARPTHTYADAGTYVARATATLADGSTATATSTVTVGNAACGTAWERTLAAPFDWTPTAAAAKGDTGFVASWSGIARMSGRQLTDLRAPADLYVAVAAISPSAILAAASDGSLAKWEGSAWSAPASPASRLADVAAPSAAVQWAAGDAVYRSTGGAWVPSLLAPAGRTFVAIEAPTDAVAYAADDAGDVWAFNGAWAALPALSSAPRSFSSTQAGELLVLTATDALRFTTAWEVLPTPPAGVAAIARHGGAIVVSGSSGLHRLAPAGWVPEPTPTGATVLAGTATSLFAFGPSRAMRMSALGVETASLTSASLARLAPAGATATAAGALGNVLAWNGGAWAPALGAGDDLTAVALLDDGSGYAASAGQILRVDANGGYTPVATQPGVRDLVLLSSAAGWAVGDGGLLLRFDGASWSPVASPTNQRLNAVAFASPEIGYAVGEAGTLLRYSSGAWTKIPSGATRALRDVAIAPDGLAHVVGDRLALRVNGATSTALAISGDQWRALTFGPDGTGWAVGDAGRIASLGPTSWTLVGSPTTAGLKDVARVGPDVLAVGDLGTALRLRRVGCTAADFALPAEQVEGTLLAFSDRSTTAAFDSLSTWSWTFGDGTTANARNPTKAYANQGVFSVRLTVTDDDGVASTKTATLRVLDAVPAAALAAPTSVVEGDVLTLDASSSAAGSPTDALTRFEWDPEGDGTFVSGGATRALSFDNQGVRRVSVRVWDEDSSATVSRDIVVVDAVPVADAGADQQVLEGEIVHLDGTASRDSPADRIVSWEWDVAPDGAFSVDYVGPTVAIELPEGLHIVDLRVTDEDGVGPIARLLVEVGNAPPVVRIVPPGDVVEGAVTTLAAEATDPGADAITFAWDLDADGDWDTAPSADPTISHVFPQEGDARVRVLATDGVLAGLAEAIVRVLDARPTAAAGGDITGIEGTPVLLSAAESAGYDAIVAWAWDVDGDGTVDLEGPQVEWLAPQGTHEVTLRVTDADGSTATDLLGVSILDAAPTAVLDLPEARVCACANVTLDASASVSPVDAIVSFEWDRDFDGTFDPDATGPTLSFEASTDTVVAVRVTDSDGSVSIATSNVLVVCFGTLESDGADSGIPGQWVNRSVVVRNPSGGPADVLVEATSNLSWAIEVMPDSLRLAALEEATVHILVFVPPDAVTGTSSTIDVTATITACVEITLGSSDPIVVDPRPARLDATPDFQSRVVLPSGSYVVPVVVANLGDLALTGISGTIDAGPGWSATLDVPETTLAGGGSQTATLTFTVPSPQAYGAFPFTLLFASANGGSDDAVVQALLPNLPPLARAGADRVVESATPVALDGSASFDPNGDALAFAWSQLAGPGVALAGASTAAPSFTSPTVDRDTALSFRLSVSDGEFVSTDDVTIVVLGRGTVDVAIPQMTRVIAPGQIASFTVVVTNRERITDSFAFTVTGLPAGWSASAPAVVGPLEPGASTLVPVLVQSPPVDQVPYGVGAGQQRALFTARATSVFWSAPEFAPLAAPTDWAFGAVNVPVEVKYSFVVERKGILGPEIAVAAPVSGFDAVYPDPFEQVRFSVRATFVDGTPLAGGILSGSVRWLGLTTDVPAIGLEKSIYTFSGIADADGRLSVTVPWTLLDLPPLQLNEPGTHRVTATAHLYDHHGAKDGRYLVDPANATRGLI